MPRRRSSRSGHARALEASPTGGGPPPARARNPQATATESIVFHWYAPLSAGFQASVVREACGSGTRDVVAVRGTPWTIASQGYDCFVIAAPAANAAAFCDGVGDADPAGPRQQAHRQAATAIGHHARPGADDDT